VLAGGLDADNVASAIAQVRPAAVDVSGGVEARKGVKDPARIQQFIAAVRAADASQGQQQ
jgi:phosphoribosylanthranilate isomerase